MARPADTDTLFSGALLVVEDSGFVAAETARMVRELGALDVHLVTRVDSALAVVEAQTLEAAILDFGLGDDTSAAIADALTAKGVPFVFASGYAGTAGIDPRFRDHPTLAKPVSPDRLREVFAPLLARR